VATGFAVGNPQLRAACPQLDIDNSVSITGGLSGGVIVRPGRPPEEGVSIARRDLRIDLARGTIAAATGFGQFGNAFDDFGHRFTTSNRNPLIAIRLPAALLARNTLVDLGNGSEDAAPSGAASRVFPIAATRATAASHTGTHTSACGLTVFRGDLLGPDARGDAFVCEPVSHLVTRRRIEPQAAGFSSRRVEPEGVDFLASRDAWFRPVFTATGPDGSLWVVDMCRGTVEHPDYMPPGLAATLDLRAGDRAGRIWRIRRDDLASRPWTPPATATEAVALFADPNGWRRSTAQRLLVEGRFADAETAVRRSLAADPGPLPAVHALWTLHGLDRLVADDLRQAAASPHAFVRESAARIAATWPEGGVAAAGSSAAAVNLPVALPVAHPVANDLPVEIASRLVGDADPFVRLAATVAAAMSDTPAAAPVLAAAAVAAPFDPWIGRAIVAGAPGRAAPVLAALAQTVRVSPASPLPGVQGPLDPDADAAAAASHAERIAFVERLGATAGGAASAGVPVAGTASQPAAKDSFPADAAAALEVLSTRARDGATDWFDVALLAGLASRRPLTAIVATSDEAAAACDAVRTAAATIAVDRDRPLADRRLAVRLLGQAARGAGSGATAARTTLTAFVGTHEPADLQGDAVTAVVRTGAADSIAAVVAVLSSLEPAVRAAAVTALLDRRDAAPLLLAAIERR
jgi:putative membrane-bound dehydrogenase-like protein